MAEIVSNIPTGLYRGPQNHWILIPQKVEKIHINRTLTAWISTIWSIDVILASEIGRQKTSRTGTLLRLAYRQQLLPTT